MRHHTGLWDQNPHLTIHWLPQPQQHHSWKAPRNNPIFHWLPKLTCSCMHGIQTTTALTSVVTWSSMIIRVFFMILNTERAGKVQPVQTNTLAQVAEKHVWQHKHLCQKHISFQGRNQKSNPSLSHEEMLQPGAEKEAQHLRAVLLCLTCSLKARCGPR